MKHSGLLQLAALAMFTAWGYSQETNTLGRPSWVSIPKQSVSTGERSDTSVQLARAAYFDVPAALRSGLPDLATAKNASQSKSIGGVEDSFGSEQLPTSSSDTIASGVVISQIPFLTQDHTQVYSELTFKPNDVIKDASHLLSYNQPVTILARGGSLRLPNGRVVSSVMFGGSNPIDLNKHYLLFLSYLPNAEAYIVRKAWDLSGPQPQELDGNGHAYSRVTTDTNQTTTPESLKSLIKSRTDVK